MASTRQYEIFIPERGGALLKAGRHSARVRFLRRVLIIGAALGSVTVGFLAFYDPFKHLPGNFSVDQVTLSGTTVTVTNPKLTGFRHDGRAYQVLADTGQQDILDSNVTDLTGVRIRLKMGDDSDLKVTAGSGRHDSLHDTMQLSGDVHVLNATGYEFFMQSMAMNFKSGEISTEEPAKLLLNGGKVEANKMHISDNGHKVTFEGSVKSVIDQDSTDTSVGSTTNAQD